MISLRMADVGDGLAVGIRTISGHGIQIDCGSQQAFGSNTALFKMLDHDPCDFFLSHFHFDHYNGLFRWNSKYHDKLNIERVYFPRIPDLPEKNVLLKTIFAMNQWILGGETGSMEADFLKILRRINSIRPKHRLLSEGDVVQVGSSVLEILWPPKSISDNAELRGAVRKAIEEFEDALQVDEKLKRIYEKIKIESYLSEELIGDNDRNNDDTYLLDIQKREAIPEPIEKANRSLRKVANRLSLAFHQDNRLLFMGDLEKEEISCVVKSLEAKRRTHFFISITPHHGTHWHESLQCIHNVWGLSSVGEKLFGKLSKEFKTICNRWLVTHLNGEIQLPSMFPCGICFHDFEDF